jgi:hypothetical protein
VRTLLAGLAVVVGLAAMFLLPDLLASDSDVDVAPVDLGPATEQPERRHGDRRRDRDRRHDRGADRAAPRPVTPDPAPTPDPPAPPVPAPAPPPVPVPPPGDGDDDDDASDGESGDD